MVPVPVRIGDVREFPHLAFQHALRADEVVEDVFGHMGVHGGQRAVQEVDLGVAVQSSSQADPLPLTAGEVDALQRDRTVSSSVIKDGSFCFICHIIKSENKILQTKHFRL